MSGKVVVPVERLEAASVVPIAVAVADVLGATVTRAPAGDDAVLGALSKPDTVLGVVPRDHHSSWTIAAASARPVILVPPMRLGVPAAVSRVLVPLDGTADSARAVADVLALLTHANVDLVVLH